MSDLLPNYILKIVELGQGTLALHRRGYRLSDELAATAQELLALEKEMALPPQAPAVETAGLDGDVAVPPAGQENILVLDVEEEAGGGPEVIRDSLGVLPPLVVDLVADEDVSGELLTPPAQPASALSAAPSDEPDACRRCGETLRPGSRYCHRCGLRRDAPI
jgi:hypothetical protein